MSILQLLEIDNNVLAINDKGELVIWDLKGNKSTNGAYFFQNNISIIPSRSKFKIDADCLLQMNNLGKIIVINNTETIYITSINHILKQLSSNHLEGVTIITASSFLDKKQLINCTILLDQSSILIGTNRGNLINYNFSLNIVTKKVNLNKNDKTQNNQLSYVPSSKRNSQIKSLSVHFNEGLVLVGLSNGRLWTFSLEIFQCVNELQTKNKQSLQSIQKIVISKTLDRIFCLHENYITQWNSKINSCVSYIQYNNPRDLLQMNENLFIVGNHSKLIWLNQSIHEIELSMRSAKTIRQISEKMIAVGGSQGAIDVFISGIRLMTLFTN